MNYFLSMKIDDNNSGIPLMSETDESIVELVKKATTVYELFTRREMRDIPVIDNEFNTKFMSNAAMDLMNGEIVDFEWKFHDKYDRKVSCYITRNV